MVGWSERTKQNALKNSKACEERPENQERAANKTKISQCQLTKRTEKQIQTSQAQTEQQLKRTEKYESHKRESSLTKLLLTRDKHEISRRSPKGVVRAIELPFYSLVGLGVRHSVLSWRTFVWSCVGKSVRKKVCAKSAEGTPEVCRTDCPTFVAAKSDRVYAA